jgi:hypothetical protein
LLGWELVGAAQFSGDQPSAALDQAMPVDEVIRLARARLEVWEGLVGRLGGANGVPRPSMLAAPRANLLLGSYDWAVLMKVDGVRSLEVLAADCGLSIYETAQIVDALANVGLVVLPPLGSAMPQWSAGRSSRPDLRLGTGSGAPAVPSSSSQSAPQRRPTAAASQSGGPEPGSPKPSSGPGNPQPGSQPGNPQPGSQPGNPQPGSQPAADAPPESDADARRRANVDTAALLKELSALNRGPITE